MSSSSTSSAKLKPAYVLDALVVLADATEYWNFGGNPKSNELSYLIESKEAKKLVENELIPCLLMKNSKPTEELKKSTLLTLLPPRIKQLEDWFAAVEDCETKKKKKSLAALWPLGFRLTPWSKENFDTKAEWHQDVRSTLAHREEYTTYMVSCLEILKHEAFVSLLSNSAE